MVDYSDVLLWILVAIFGIFIALDWLGFFSNDDKDEDKK